MDGPSPLRPRQLTPQIVSEVRQAIAILDQGPTPVSSSLTSTISAIQAVSTASIASTTIIASTVSTSTATTSVPGSQGGVEVTILHTYWFFFSGKLVVQLGCLTVTLLDHETYIM